jgi:SAM-dependent methyltransferase
MTREESHFKVIEISKNLKRGTILDVPAGQGALAVDLQRMGFAVVCADIDPGHFKVEGIENFYADLNKTLPFEDASFDYICCVAGLHRVWNLRSTIKEFGRVLKKNGYLIISIPNYSNIDRRIKFLFRGSLSKSVNLQSFDQHAKEQSAFFRSNLLYPQLKTILLKNNFNILSLYKDKTKKSSIAFFPMILLIKLYKFFSPKKTAKEHFLDDMSSSATRWWEQHHHSMPEELNLEKIRGKDYSGYVFKGFDTSYLFERIRDYGDKVPFYQSEPHRRVFYEGERNIYIKIVYEARSFLPLFSWTASGRYLKFYRVLKRLGISTPELLACLKVRQKNQLMSIIATKGIPSVQGFGTFLASAKDSSIKNTLIKELAKMAATIHKAGYYFSMDFRNILVKAIDKGMKLFILNLEHMKSTFLAKRRIKRNLNRFKRGLLSVPGTTADDIYTFFEQYRKLRKDSRKIFLLDQKQKSLGIFHLMDIFHENGLCIRKIPGKRETWKVSSYEATYFIKISFLNNLFRKLLSLLKLSKIRKELQVFQRLKNKEDVLFPN